MSTFRHVLKPPRWLRVALVALALVFVLDSVAHAAHRHEISSSGAQKAHCGYCATFGSAADAERVDFVGPVRTGSLLEIADHCDLVAKHSPWLFAQPRAPPIS